MLLDEWLKELSAVAQEQLVMMLTELPDNVPAAKGSVLQQVPELRKSGNGPTMWMPDGDRGEDEKGRHKVKQQHHFYKEIV